MNLQDSYKKVEQFIKNGIVNNTLDPRVHFYAQSDNLVIPMDCDAVAALKEHGATSSMIIWRVVVKPDGKYSIVCENIY